LLLADIFMLLEGDVIPFRKKRQELGPQDKVKFRQISGVTWGDAHNTIEKEAPGLSAKFPAKAPVAAHVIHVNDKLYGYMMTHNHTDAGGKPYRVDTAFDLHGNKIPMKKASLTDLFQV